VQATLNDQRNARARDQHREIYAQFIERAQRLELAPSRNPDDLAPLAHAMVMVRLEGPEPVVQAATAYYSKLADVLSGDEDRDSLARVRNHFYAAARDALAR
jgi:hypothetical protein